MIRYCIAVYFASNLPEVRSAIDARFYRRNHSDGPASRDIHQFAGTTPGFHLYGIARVKALHLTAITNGIFGKLGCDGCPERSGICTPSKESPWRRDRQ